MAGNNAPEIQTLHLTLDGGMDQRTYERHVQPPLVLDALNLRYDKNGGAKKRPGCALYAAAPTAGRGKLIAFQDELLLTDGHSMCTATGAIGGVAEFLVKDKYPEAVPSLTPVAASQQGTITYPDMASLGGALYYAWIADAAADSAATEQYRGYVYTTVQDEVTGAEIISSQAVTPLTGPASWFSPRLVVSGPYIVLLAYSDGGLIRAWRWNEAVGIWDTQTDLVADGFMGTIPSSAAHGYYDAAGTTFVGGGRFYVVYRQVTTNAIIIKEFNPQTMTLTASKTCTETANNSTGFGISATDSEHVVISYCTTSAPNTLVRIATYDSALTTEQLPPTTIFTSTTTAEQAMRTASCRLSASQSAILISTKTVVGGAVRVSLMDVETGVALGAPASGRRTYWCTAMSRPFVSSTSPLRVMAWVACGGAVGGTYTNPPSVHQDLQFTMTLLDLGADDMTSSTVVGRPVCWSANRFTVGDYSSNANPSSAVQSGSVWSAAFRTLESASRQQLQRASADFSSTSLGASAALGRALLVAPGWVWDRSRLFEQSFCYWPQTLSDPTFSNSGGHLTTGGKYRRVVVYEWVDSQGNLHQSEPSDPIEFTATNNTASYFAPHLCVTARTDAASFSNIGLAIYGTDDINAGADPDTYYRVFALWDTPLNNTGNETLQIFDGGNTSLTTQPQLYADGGALPNTQPQGFRECVTYRNRAWIAYGNTVAYSKAYVEGDAISFTDEFTLPLEQADAITKLWVMDDRLFISTKNRIYWLQADGPDDDGSGNDIATPNRVATDLGVTDPRSVVVTPMGTLYQSAVGLELLDRSLQVAPEPVGYRVKTELAVYPTVTCATVHPTAGHVMFGVNNGSTGEQLVYTYTNDKWSRDVLLSGAVILSTVVQGGTVYFLTSNGNVYQETPANYLDAGAWVTAKVKTAWLHPGGAQATHLMHRLLWMGDKATDHDLSIVGHIDYASATDHTWTFPATGGDTPLNSMPLPQVSVDLATQRVQAICFEISDATPTGGTVGTGQGSLYAAIAVDYETDGNSWELPAAQKG